MLGTLMTSVKSTLKSIDADAGGRLAQVAITLSIKRDSTKPAPPNPTGMTLRHGRSTGDGEQIFDVGTGLLRSSTVRFDDSDDDVGQRSGRSPLNMQTNVKSTTTTEMVK